MSNIISLKFGPTTSKYFKKVVLLAKSFKNALLSDDSKVCIIRMTPEEFLQKQKQFFELQKLIRNWESAEFAIASRYIKPFKTITQRLKPVLQCANGYTKTPTYCHIGEYQEAWGCKHLLKIKLHLLQELDLMNDEEFWYKFGHFRNRHTWEIDKRKIEIILHTEIVHKHLQICPYFSMKKVKEKITALPDEIDLVGNTSWEVETIKDFEDDEIVEKPIGISHLREEIVSEQENNEAWLKRRLINSEKLLKSAKKTTEKKRQKRNIPKTRFNEIGGIDDIIAKIREVIELPIVKPELFSHLGIQPHKGIILYGPPGTGKTMIAKAIANEIKAHFILVNGPEILSKWQGKSEKNIRDIFEEANKFSPSVIFFDEIDAIASKRSGGDSGRSSSRIVNQLLTLFDGVTENKGVVIIASTNRIELIDPAILRSGRFDYKIEVPNPNLEGCLTILELKTREMPLDKSFNLIEFSKSLLGLSGAEIAFIANEAAYNAMRRSVNIKELIDNQLEQEYHHLLIEKQDFEKALATLKKEKQTSKKLGF